MSWLLPVEDLRSELSDGATDKLRYKKRVLNRVDGTNVRFKIVTGKPNT